MRALEDHGTVPIDINKGDKACTQATPLGSTLWHPHAPGLCRLTSRGAQTLRYAGLMTLRQPDAIQAVQVDGKTYVLTANEGDDKAGSGLLHSKVSVSLAPC